MKKIYLSLILALLLNSCSKSEMKIKYSLYEYLPDANYYREIIEDEWYKIHPNVKLEYVPYNCYHEDPEKDIDVIMYDAMCESYLIENSFVKKIAKNKIADYDDFFDFTVEDIKENGVIYGIPAMICTRVFFYDETNEVAANANNVYDLAPIKNDVLINVDDDRFTYYLEVMADSNEKYDTSEKTEEQLLEKLSYIRDLANQNYLEASANDLADAYDDGVGSSFFAFTETYCRLDKRKDNTRTKILSFGDDKNVSLFYCDMVSLTNYVETYEEDLCIDLMNLICSLDVMNLACLNKDGYNRLLFPRNSFYENKQEDELYTSLYEIIKKDEGKIIRKPASAYEN